MDRIKVDLYSDIASCLFDQLCHVIDEEAKLDIDPALLLQLSELDSRARSFVERHAIHYLTLHIDEAALSKVLHQWHVRRDDIELEDRFLLLHASQNLMRELFGMHAL